MCARSLTVGLLFLANSLTAQLPGDSIRFRVSTIHGRHDGRVIRVDSTMFTIRAVLRDQPITDEHQYNAADITGMLVWRRKHFGRQLLLSTILGVAAWELGRAFSSNKGPVFGSEAADVAFSAVMGAGAGALDFGIDPGSWHRVRR
jgi:hypothetical protein